MREWSTLRMMKEARDAHWFGYDDYALDILMEIAQEEINDHVQETFDLSCQPRPKRSKAKTVRTGTIRPSHSQGKVPRHEQLQQLAAHLYGNDESWLE